MRLIVELEPDGTLTWITGLDPLANQGKIGEHLQDRLCETCRGAFLGALKSIASGAAPHARVPRVRWSGSTADLTATLLPVCSSHMVVRILAIFSEADSADGESAGVGRDATRTQADQATGGLQSTAEKAALEDPRFSLGSAPQPAFDLRELLKALPDLIVRLGIDGRILDVLPPSSRPCPIFRNAIAKHLAEVMSPESAARILECLGTAIATRLTQSCQFELGTDRGRTVYEVRIVAHAVREALAIVRDITDREASDQGLNRAERLAAIGTLATSIAHELNNPIGAALLSAETILALPHSVAPSDQVSNCLRNIVESLARCGAIIRHLLNFAKDQPGEKQVQDVYTLLCRSCDLTRLYAERVGAHLEVVQVDDLPPIEASPLDLELVLVNLIQNAVKSRPYGARVRISAQLRQDTLLLIVEDNGYGMTVEELHRLCEPFYTTRRHDGGTGLGLHVANRIVHEYGGELHFESVVDKGTRAAVALPLRRLRVSVN